MELIDFSSSVWSIIPALLAIVLAIATRRVLVSLSAGIIVGALMLGGWILAHLSVIYQAT